ncbi:MAG: hypothetical protein ACJA04_000184, partial [Cellvibrionaceae bacterium]
MYVFPLCSELVSGGGVYAWDRTDQHYSASARLVFLRMA